MRRCFGCSNPSARRAPSLHRRALGVEPDQVEALAFAWLAHAHVSGQSGNVPSVTGARGGRILGALYPATSIQQVISNAVATKKAPAGAFHCLPSRYAENEDPQPHVVVAFGFLITNCAPSKSSL